MPPKIPDSAVKKVSREIADELFDIDYGFMGISPENIRNLRIDTFGDSLAEFGMRLAHAISHDHEPFSRQYIHRLEHGLDRITPEIEAAYWNLATAIDETPIGIGGAVNVHLLAQPGQITDGSFIPRSAKSVKCANPNCPVVFVKTHPRQKYHDPECRRNI